MRPVNLIPPDERRGDRAPLRTGAFSYVLVGGLALLLLGVLAVALTNKQISDRQAEKQSLEQELAQATAKAQSLQAFTDFRMAQETRAATVASLAQSRFDWERVLNELALILPSDVWLVSLTGTVNPSVTVDSGGGGSSESSAGSGIRAEIAGPALEISGCAVGQDAVAGFVASLEDVDGVTRVGLAASKVPEDEAQGGTTGTGAGGSSEAKCIGPDVVEFQLVVAFDAVPVPATATGVPSLPPAPPSGSSGTDQSQVSDGQQQQAVQAASTRQQTTKAQNAAENLIPGG
jgi:Tfp pilus assembly protein PilN